MDIGRMRNKEYGSDFYYPVAPQWRLDQPNNLFFASSEVSLFFSGRSALYHLLVQGIANQNWSEVYLPSYYCHEVYRFVEELPINMHYYHFNPALDTALDVTNISDRDDCVLVTTSFFGMKTAATSLLKQAIIVEDLTHKIEACVTSNAHYCFGSLRKELPVGVGGFCYSPQGLQLPEGKPNLEADKVAELKIEAMRQKQTYLKGSSNDKANYLDHFAISESQFEADFTRAAMPEIAKRQLFSLNIDGILEQKQKNLRQATDALSHFGEITFLGTNNNRPTLGLIFQCKNAEIRNALRSHLIENNVYPAILWPDQKGEKDRLLEATILFIHTDFRYDAEDISEIIKKITSYFAHA
jgi:hypothetical protein